MLGDWLTAELRRVVTVGRLSGEFRDWLHNNSVNPIDAFRTLNEYGDALEVLKAKRDGTSPFERAAFDRIFQLNITVANPVLLWLLVQSPQNLPAPERELAVRAIESFVVRRMAAKWPTRAYAQTFVEVLAAASAAGSRPGPAIIEALRSNPHGYSWPTNSDLVEQFTSTRYYGPGGMGQGRLRLLLGAIDAKLQSDFHKAEPVSIDYDSLQVEHLIPQSWRSTWPVQGEDPAHQLMQEQEREAHLHRIGNLTLVSASLNPALSNDPWEAKKAELQKHSKLRLNALLCEQQTWDEGQIRERGRWLAEQLSRVWPGPESDEWNTA